MEHIYKRQQIPAAPSDQNTCPDKSVRRTVDTAQHFRTNDKTQKGASDWQVIDMLSHAATQPAEAAR